MINQRVFVSWLPFAIAVTFVLGTVYAAVQQNYRQSANDPQIQLAEDGVSLLKEGVPPSQLAPGLKRIDISNSLGTFALFFDGEGKYITGSGFLGTGTPQVPEGMILAAKGQDANMVTWQIPSGQRFAAVVKYWERGNASTTSSGYILLARSLREIENREFKLELIVGIAWLITMVLSLVAVWFKILYDRKYLNRG